MTPQGTALRDTCNQQLARNPKNGWVGFPLWESSQQAEGLDQARENPCQDTAFGAKLSYIAPVAQGIEQRIPNPCAAGSIPAGGTNDIPKNTGGLALPAPFPVFGLFVNISRFWPILAVR